MTLTEGKGGEIILIARKAEEKKAYESIQKDRIGYFIGEIRRGW